MSGSKCSVINPSDYDFFELLRSNDLESKLQWASARIDYEGVTSIQDASIYLRLLVVKSKRKNHIERLKLINLNKFNEKGPAGLTLGHCFAWSGDLDELKDVLKLGLIKPEYLTTNKEPTIWHYLALSGNWEALKQAIDDKLFDPEALKDNESGTIWYWLARSGNLYALKKAIASGLCDSKHIWHGLARSGNFAALEQAIKEGLFEPSELEKDAQGWGLGHYLAKSGNLEGLQEAIKRGWCDESVWEVFASGGNTTAIMQAIDLGLLDPEKITASGKRILDLIFASKDTELFRYAISRNFDFNEFTLDSGSSYYGNINLFVELNANLNYAHENLEFYETKEGKELLATDEGLNAYLREKFESVLGGFSLGRTANDTFSYIALNFMWIVEKLKGCNESDKLDFLSYQYMLREFLKSLLKNKDNLALYGKDKFAIDKFLELLAECYRLPVSSNVHKALITPEVISLLLSSLSLRELDLLDLSLLKNANPEFLEKELIKALEKQDFERVNCFLKMPQMRQIAKQNSLFIESIKSGLLFDIDDLEAGGDGNSTTESKLYPDQAGIIKKITEGLIPLLRDRQEYGYDKKSLQAIDANGFCLALSYLFLYAMEQSRDKTGIDNIHYFERMLQLIMDTDFEGLKTKPKLSPEDSKLIMELDHFLQKLLLYQNKVDIGIVDKDKYITKEGPMKALIQNAVLFSLTDDNRGSQVDLGGIDPQELFHPGSIDGLWPSLEKLSDGKISELGVDKIAGSAFNSFFLFIPGHAIAVKRDPENKDLFWVYDPNSNHMSAAKIKKLGNPARIGAKYLEGYLRDLAHHYKSKNLIATGFNFTKPQPKAKKSPK